MTSAPHARQKCEQTSGQNVAPNASKQGDFGSLVAIFLFIILPCMRGLGLRKESPMTRIAIGTFRIAHHKFIAGAFISEMIAHPISPEHICEFVFGCPRALFTNPLGSVVSAHKSEQLSAPSVAILLRLQLRFSDAGVPSAPPESLAIFPCNEKSLVIAILFAIFRGPLRFGWRQGRL